MLYERCGFPVNRTARIIVGQPVAARSGSLICSSNNNDNYNQLLKTIHNQIQKSCFVERSQ